MGIAALHPSYGLRASQLAGAPGTVCGESLIRKRIKPAGARIPFNRGVEPQRVEGLEPCAKPRQLARGKLFDGLSRDELLSMGIASLHPSTG
jgi:hypothetical protein